MPNLGSAADAGAIRMAYDAGNGSLSVAYAPAAGPLVTRTVAAPARSGEAAELAVLLAGNLARDQAAELLGETLPSPAFAAESTWEPPAAPPTDATLLSRWFHFASPVLGRLDTEAWTSNLSLINVGARLPGRHPTRSSTCGHLESGQPLVGPGLTLGAARACPSVSCAASTSAPLICTAETVGEGYTLNQLIFRARAHVELPVGRGRV